MSTLNEPRARRWGVRLLVLALSVAIHGALVVWLMGSRFSHPLLPPTESIAVELVAVPFEPDPEPEPEPEPEPVPPPRPEPVAKPAPRPAPRPQPAPAPPS